jgi:hypothetical protein
VGLFHPIRSAKHRLESGISTPEYQVCQKQADKRQAACGSSRQHGRKLVRERMRANTRNNDESDGEGNSVEFESGCWHSDSWIVEISGFASRD